MSLIIKLAYIIILLLAARTDYHTRMIYDKIHISILLLSIAQMILIPEYRIIDRLIGAMIIAGPMLILTIMIPGAFGGGDIKLMAVSGFFLGIKSIVCAMVLGIVAGSIYGIVMLGSRKISKKDCFAFGPFLAVGLIIATFAGNQIVSWYLG